jgi:hypothetical protein
MESLLGQEFETMAKARDSIKETIINAGLSYKTLKAKSMCYILVCKDNTCIEISLIICIFINKNTGLFRLRASYLRRPGIARITIYTPHTCSITTHTNFRHSNATSYTLPHHISAISQDRNLKPKHITNQEQLQHLNQLSYQQAWRTKEKAIQQIKGDQSEQFALLPTICYYIRENHEDSIANCELYPDQSFHRLFIAPGALRYSFGMHLRHLIAIDATYTTSRTYFFSTLF